MTPPSLNEIARRIRDAALGLGWSAGTAEDIGQAAAWLSARGIDGVGVAMRAVGPGPAAVSARQTGEGWRIGPLPAALAGPAALDILLSGDGPVTVELTDAPDLLLGLAGHASAQTGRDIALSGGLSARIEAGRLGAGPAPGPDGAITLMAGGAGDPGPPVLLRTAPDPDAWAKAARLASRRLVPATRASRERGAGAGEIDGD